MKLLLASHDQTIPELVPIIDYFGAEQFEQGGTGHFKSF